MANRRPTTQEVAARVGARLAVPPHLDTYRLEPRHTRQPLLSSVPATKGAETAGATEADSSSSLSEPLHAGSAAIGLGGAHMRLNASLAVALAAEFESQYAAAAAAAAAAGGEARGSDAEATQQSVGEGTRMCLPPDGPDAAAAARRAAAVARGELPREYAEGLEAVRWPGRSQVSLLRAEWGLACNGWSLTAAAVRRQCLPHQAASQGSV